MYDCVTPINDLTASDNLEFKFASDGEGNHGYLGADGSFIPFKSGSGYPVYINEICNKNYQALGCDFIAPADTYFYILHKGMYGPGTFTATNANVLVQRSISGTYAGRSAYCLIKTTNSGHITVSAGTKNIPIDPSIITTPKDKGEAGSFNVTSGKYYIATYFPYGGDDFTFTGCTKLSGYIEIISGASYFGCALLKATSSTISCNKLVLLLEL